MGIYGTTVTEWSVAGECQSRSQQVLWEMEHSVLKKFSFAAQKLITFCCLRVKHRNIVRGIEE